MKRALASILSVAIVVAGIAIAPQDVRAAVPVIEGYQKSDTGGSTETTLTCTAPSGIQAGELLFIFAGSDENGNTDGFSISGWTEIAENGDSSTDARIAAYYKTASGGDGDATLNTTESNETWCVYMRISGVDTADPINAQSEDGGSCSSFTSCTMSRVTTDEDDTLVLVGLSFDGGDGDPFAVSGTGWTKGDDITSGTRSTEASGVFAYASQESAGTGASVTFTPNTTDGAVTIMVALNAGAAAPSDSCTYGGSGDWTIDSADNCVISVFQYVNGDVFLSDTGDGGLYIYETGTLSVGGGDIQSTSTPIYVGAGGIILLGNDG